MQVSSAIENMKESATLAVSAKAAALKATGVDVVGFGVGEPDFDTPEPIKRAAIRALEAGMTKYPPTPGDRASREAIASKLRRENGIDCSFEHISITVGAKHAIYLALQTMVERGAGNEVIVPTPAWVSYRPVIELAGARCVEVPSSLDDGFLPCTRAIERAITPRTVGIILNSPSNPCGVTVPEARLRALADVVARHERVAVISDEIYEKLIYPEVTPGLRHWSIGSDPRLAGRTITVNGLSKAYAMTGWRVGYLCAPGDGGRFAREAIKLQGQMTNSISSFAMPAIVEALTNGGPDVERMRATFAQRAQLVHRLLSAIPGLQAPASDGAFYTFPSIASIIGESGATSAGGRRMDSAQSFAEALLDEQAVAVVPGEDFGECARKHIRLSFACSEAQIHKGLERLAAFVAGIRQDTPSVTGTGCGRGT